MRINKDYVWITAMIMMSLSPGTCVFAQRTSGQSPTPIVPPNMPTGTTKDTASGPQTPTSQSPSKKENQAIKAFREAPANDPDKKLQLGENFLQMYPQSRYRIEVIDWEVKLYLTKAQVDKLQAAGERELALTPNNPQTLADVCAHYSRALTPSTPELSKRLDQAESYCKKSLELLAAVQKPADVSADTFTLAKNETSSMAYSGLGLVDFRKAKYPDAIANLGQAVKLDKNPDPVNYYVLGKANEAASHFPEAVEAFTKCAAIPGYLQATCTSSIEEAKTAQLNTK